MAAPSQSSRRTLVVAAVVAVLAAVAAVVWFLSGDAPTGVDIEDAADAVTDDATADDTATDAPTTDAASPSDDEPAAADDTAAGGDDADGDAAAEEGVDGTWVVDTSIGEFSVLDTTGTFVGFRIDEELANIGATEAIGRTPDVSGELTISDGMLTAATVTADLTGIRSDRSRRDGRIQSALGTSTFPTTTFVLTEPVALDGLAAGEVAAVVATGTLTIRDVEQPVEIPLQATLRDGVAIVTGSFEVTFADYGVEVPTAPIVLGVADVGTVELQLYLTRG